jgi:hypothetical protein
MSDNRLLGRLLLSGRRIGTFIHSMIIANMQRLPIRAQSYLNNISITGDMFAHQSSQRHAHTQAQILTVWFRRASFLLVGTTPPSEQHAQ